MEFLEALINAGFEGVEHMHDTGFNSSPKTKGTLVRACKPLIPSSDSNNPEKNMGEGTLAVSKSASISKSLTLGNIVERAIQLGAEKAKVIDTDSVVVEKWVKWKCVYGCPMYGKDGYHPPMTPEINEVKDVMGEYAKAVLFNGENGRLMTEIACRLESEAYNSGYYKAFALTALSGGTEGGSNAGST